MRLSEERTDRGAGVLLATAAGDALGAGYEFTTPGPDVAIEMIGGGIGSFAPGEWTDDTSMAIAIAEVATTGVDISGGPGLDAVAAQFVRWYESGPPDIGIQTSAVLSNRPASADEMRQIAWALPGRKGGNGLLMRTAPVALAYLGDVDGCLRAARAISLLTHHDERAVEACEMWTYAIRHAVLHGTFDGVREYLAEATASAREYWAPQLDLAERGAPADFPNNGWVVHALLTAWWAITTTDASGPEHLEQALERAVRAGHDTDTTAAIAGGLLGARWGASAVPARWRRMLHGWPGYRAEDLVRLGVRTAWGGDDREGWPSSPTVDYGRYDTGRRAVHLHDDGVVLGGADLLVDDRFDAVVSLCRTGTAPVAGEHIPFWLIDAGEERNPNLEFVIGDAARTVLRLRQQGLTVALHCVEGRSRTPAVAARYSMLLGHNPDDLLEAMPWARPNPRLWKVATTPKESA
nr:ADP-ribosylglycohydrolase family protein [Rhodococcus sp. WMMA185]